MIVRLLTGAATQRVQCPVGKRVRVMSVLAAVNTVGIATIARLIIQTDSTSQYFVCCTAPLTGGEDTISARLGTVPVLGMQASVDPGTGQVAYVNASIAEISLPDVWMENAFDISLTGSLNVTTFVVLYEELPL